LLKCSLTSPIWFKTILNRIKSATLMGYKSLFQAIRASFQSLGLFIAFSLHQRLTRARNPGLAHDHQ
jgi:hypothetical protein